MADTLDILTLAEAKSVLKITNTDAARDIRLERVITAVSRRLDDEFGPIVKRTIAVKTYTPAAWDLWVDPSPIYSTPAITITEYDSEGVSQLLTLETFDTKPDHGYRLTPRAGLGGGYTGRIRRTEGSIASTWGTVRVTYDAGRYSATSAVDALFKHAAGVLLDARWDQERPHVQNDDDELPSYFIPPEAMEQIREIIPADERPGRSVLA